MKTLLDYVEQYLKEEGLSSAIPDERKRGLFQASSNLWKLLWISGTLAITIWMTWDFGGFWTGFNFGVGALWIFNIGHALWITILKKKGQSSERSIYLIGRAFLIGYHLALLGFIFFLTVGWKGYYEETLVAAILFLLLYFLIRMGSSSHLVVLGWHSLQTLLRLIGRSLSGLLTVAPLLLGIVILSIFSRDIFLILENISWDRYGLIVLVLVVPPMFLSYARVKEEGKNLVEKYPQLAEIPARFENSDFFTRKFMSEYISPKEWENTIAALAWRDQNKVQEGFAGWIESVVTKRLAIFNEAITIFLTLLFSLYFFVLFLLLFPPEASSEWMGIDTLVREYTFGVLQQSINLPVVLETYLKVALILAIIVSIIARISITSNQDFKEKALAWLSEKSQDWMAAQAIYNALLHPNYQLWDTIVNNKNITHICILVPAGLDEEQVREACRYQANQVAKRVNTIIVSAFEKEENGEVYGFGRHGNRWQLLVNKKTDIETFKNLAIGSEDGLRYAHDLGFEAIAGDQTIPDAWFGDYEFAIEIGKAIWEIDPEHSLIWHPYVSAVDGMVLAHISVTRKFQKSSDYQQFMNRLLNVIEEKADRHKTIDIRLEFRDSMDVIASMEYFKPTSSIRYRDETMRKSKNQKYDAWINNLLEGS